MKETKQTSQIKKLSFIELLVAALLVEFIVLFFLFFSRKVEETVRDSTRKKNIAQIGRIITNPCFIPDQKLRTREFDLFLIIDNIVEKSNTYNFSSIEKIRDPKTGTNEASMYIYKIDETNSNCVIYTNLESSMNKVNLKYEEAIPGGGTGIFEAKIKGWNGSPFYFQYSN